MGYALSFDHDLEMFAASVGLIKTSVEAVLKDKGELLRMSGYALPNIVIDVEVELGSIEPDQDFFGPLQKLLDQSRSAKVLSK